MKIRHTSAQFLIGAVIAAASTFAHAAPQIVNGDFETGDLTGWSTYTLVGGVIGTPSVVSIDVTQGVASLAAQLHVGEISYLTGISLGGGLQQTFTVDSSGQFQLHADVMSAGNVNYDNADGGTFSLYIDDVSVANYAVGYINSGVPARGALNYVGSLSQGDHTIKLEATRIYEAGQDTPSQYFDNVSVSAVPEASSVEAMLLGMAMIGGLQTWRRARKA